MVRRSDRPSRDRATSPCCWPVLGLVCLLLLLPVSANDQVTGTVATGSRLTEADTSSMSVPQVQKYAALLEKIWKYQPELPKYLLDQAIGLQVSATQLGHRSQILAESWCPWLAGQPGTA